RRLVGIPVEQACYFGFDSLRQQRSGTVAQHLRQRIDKTSWLGKLENVSLGHGVSLLCWRSGGVEHPHDTPPYPFTPSPTFDHSSRQEIVAAAEIAIVDHPLLSGSSLRRHAMQKPPGIHPSRAPIIQSKNHLI